MQEAATDFAAGRPVPSPPPSLRVYTLAKQIPSMFGPAGILGEDGQLVIELELYAHEEAVAAMDRARQEQARSRREASSSGRGRRRFGRRHG